MTVEHNFNSREEYMTVISFIDKEIGLEHETTFEDGSIREKGTICIFDMLPSEIELLMNFLKDKGLV